MEPRQLLETLSVAEHLKDATRHCYTKGGRHESVAEHSWMMTLMAFFMKDEFPEVDMDKVIKMCIIHDLGEAFTGDIPTFEKTQAHEVKEEELLYRWVKSLPESYAAEMLSLYEERYPYGATKEECVVGLTNFSIADADPDPKCLQGKIWQLIKLDFVEERK